LTKENNVTLVAHDAGGAEILSSWAILQKKNYSFCIEGPALNIFKRKFGEIKNQNLDEALKKSNLLVCGTSWESRIEIDAIEISKRNKIKSIAILDHWVNFKERFFIGEKLIIPDELWVVDVKAKSIAKNFFPSTKILQIPNYYMNDIVSEAKNKQLFFKSTAILYICEPIRRHNTIKLQHVKEQKYNELDAIDFFLENISAISKENKQIIFRPHPSEKPEDYKWIINKYDRYNIEISEDKNLIEDICRSAIVLGCESMAMVVALKLNKRVISSIPIKGLKHCLPFKKIEYLYKLIKA